MAGSWDARSRLPATHGERGVRVAVGHHQRPDPPVPSVRRTPLSALRQLIEEDIAGQRPTGIRLVPTVVREIAGGPGDCPALGLTSAELRKSVGEAVHF